MAKRNLVNVRVLKEDRERMKKLALKVSNVEGKIVSNSELTRRILNIQRLQKVLEEDAFNKRRFRNVR